VSPLKMLAGQVKKTTKKTELFHKTKKSLLCRIAHNRTISHVLKLFYVIFTCSFPKAIMKRSFKSHMNSAGNVIQSAESWRAIRKGQNQQKCLFWVLSFLLK